MDENMRALMARLEELLNNVHQYVGARYVPNFIDDPWNDTTRYDALDVVDNGSGTSYIAKKPVPPGTPLSDRNYWFVYGSTSGAIINLQNQIDAIRAGFVTPEMFGAVGDGLTDDSTAFQAAFLSGSPIYCLNKEYVVDSKTTITNGIDSLIIEGNGCTIITKSEDATANWLKLENVSYINIRNMNIKSTADKADASIYNRPAGNTYSNVTFLKADTFKQCILDNITTTDLEGLAKVEDEVATKTDLVQITNCNCYKCNACIFAKHSKKVFINNVVAHHIHSSGTDHTIYISTDVDDLIVSDVISDSCVGSGIHIYGVSGYDAVSDNYIIDNCKVLNGTNGGIYIMGGKGQITNCHIELPTNVEDYPIRNKGSQVRISNCYFKGYWALLAENSNLLSTVPNTWFKDCTFDIYNIEGDKNKLIDGLRSYDNCKFTLEISGAANLIETDSAAAEIDFYHCTINRASSYNYNIIKSSTTTTAKLAFNNLLRRGTLYDGDDANVVGTGNICFAECSTNTGKYAGNTTGFYT